MLTWALMWAATRGVTVPALVVFATIIGDCVMVIAVVERLAK